MGTDTMSPPDVALAVIGACEDRAEVGRTSIQKVAYFVGVSLGLDLGHQAHLYGPYSRLLEREVGALVFAGEVEESQKSLGYSGPFGERTQYQYGLTEGGRKRLRALEDEYPEETGRIADAVATLEEVAGNLSQGRLAPAAKTFYLIAQQKGVSGFEEVKELAEEYGWKLRGDQAEEIIKLLTELRLITASSEG